MPRHGTDQWLVPEVRGKDGGGYAREAYIDTFREGLRRVAPWRIHSLSKAISWAVSFMAANATHHKFSAVPGVQQPLLLQGPCADGSVHIHALMCVYHIIHMVSHLNTYIGQTSSLFSPNSWRPRSSGKKAVWVSHGSPGCRCPIKHIWWAMSYTEHIWWAMWPTLWKLSFRAQVVSLDCKMIIYFS